MIQNQLYRHFGLAGPREGILETRTTREVARRINDCIHDNDFMAIVAGIGSGKTTVTTNVFRSIKQEADDRKGREYLILLPILSTAERGLNYGDILDEIIEELGGDTIRQSPSRSVRARAKQVSRIMVMMDKKDVKVCVYIDRAHYLHPETIKALKGLRELNYYSSKPLFSLILIGEPSLGDKISRTGEIRARISQVPMEYDKTEMAQIIDFHLQGMMQVSDASVLADRYTKPMYFIDDLKKAMNSALLLDKQMLTLDDFPVAPVTPAPMITKRGRKVKVDENSVSDVLGRLGLSQDPQKQADAV